MYNNQSIGPSQEGNKDIIKYYSNKLKENKTTLDFVFEWIRSQKIRLSYKKFLIKAQYPSNDLNLAIDDFIFLFFLKYYEILRTLFQKDLLEYEFSALLEIFFTSYDIEEFNLSYHLEKHRNNPKCPTIIRGSERIDTHILTLRAGLSDIIKRDYEQILLSRYEERK